MVATPVLGATFTLFYFSYYLFVIPMSSKSQNAGRESNYHPKVSIVASTCNEEAIIEKKLGNSMP